MRNQIEDFRLETLYEGRFVHAALAHYTQNGQERDWEVVKAHDSVAILIYHRDKDAFVLVKQFRPAVYAHNQDGMTVELCAGMVDKKLSLQRIAAEEIEEECGYHVPDAQVEKVSSFYTSVGFAGSRQTLYYAEVDESMRVSEGGGIDNEVIEVIELPIDEAKTLLYDESIAKTPGLMFAFMWWFDRTGRR
jgi:UDP-sugar diphosphatase